MWRHHHWFHATFNGILCRRSHLIIIWPMGWLSSLFGWTDVLPISRIITALASLITTYFIGQWIKLYESDRTLQLLAMACFLSGDLLFMRGWLAYPDPMFTLYLFAGQYFLFAANCKKKKLIRYLMSTYPTIAIAGAYIIYHASGGIQLSIKALCLTLCIKVILLFFGYPLLVHKTHAYRYQPIASEIVVIIKQQPLYTQALIDYPTRIIMHINTMRSHSGFVLYKPYDAIPHGAYYLHTIQQHPTEQVAQYAIGHHKLFLNKKALSHS